MERLSEARGALACDLVSEILRKFGRARMRVSGISMMPALRPGDLVSIERVTPREILRGEIIVFAREGRLITHRVITKQGVGADIVLITRGDHTHANDAPVSPHEFLGRVTSVDRGRRRFAPSRWLHGHERPLERILRKSDRATAVFLYVSRFRQSLAGQGAECQS
jgi:signal peptidase I